MFDPATRKYYIYYRLRKPRELGRGVDCRVAISDDGVSFRDIWQATKEEIDTQSMEKACLFKVSERLWRLYMSFVDADGRWCIEMVEAERPDRFDVSKRIPILNADDCGAEGVKDPHIYCMAGLLHMIVSYAPKPETLGENIGEKMHGTGDVYNTGIVKSHSGLAVSGNGVDWEWIGDILTPPDTGWDQYCTRINSVIGLGNVFVGFYDGSRDETENFEERCGVCVSEDLRTWQRLTAGRPWVDWPHATGSMRYVNALRVGEQLYYHYEAARPDGGHELRVQIEPAP